jgi:chemotaxis protein histidine kinase CheA
LLALAFLPLLCGLACGESASNYPSASVASATPTLGGVAGAFLEAELAENRLQEAEDLATVQAAQSQATVNAAASDADAAQEWVAAQATGTAQAISAHATIVALDIQATAQAAAFESTRTAEAQHGTATAQAASARGTATAQAERVHATATSVAERTTATAVARFATATAQAERATATTDAYQAGQTATVDAHRWMQTVTADAVTATAQAMIVQRERVTQPLRTWGPWILTLLAVVAVGFLGYRAFVVWELRKRALERDQRGDAPVLALQRPGGGVVIYDPDRAWGPATIVDVDVVHPNLAPPEYQERTTARDQAIDLATRGLTRKPVSRRRRLSSKTMRPAPPPVPGPQIRVVRPDRVLPWIKEMQGQLIEGDQR